MQNPLTVHSPGGPVAIFYDIDAPSVPSTVTLHLTLLRPLLLTGGTRRVSYRLNLR